MFGERDVCDDECKKTHWVFLAPLIPAAILLFILKSRTEDELERLQKYQHHHEEIHFVEEQRLRAIADASQAKLSTYKEALEVAEKDFVKIKQKIDGMQLRDAIRFHCIETIYVITKEALTQVRKALEEK